MSAFRSKHEQQRSLARGPDRHPHRGRGGGLAPRIRILPVVLEAHIAAALQLAAENAPAPARGVAPVGAVARAAPHGLALERALAADLAASPGVIEHGLFPPELVTDVLVGRGDAVERLR